MATDPAPAGADELERLRAELAAEKQKTDRLSRKTELFDAERRAQIQALQPDVDSFVSSLGEEFADYRTRMQPIQNWAKGMTEMTDPEHQIPLASVLYCASAKLKRTQEQMSQQSTDAEALGRLCKENEALKEEVSKAQKRSSELEAHVGEMDKRNAELDKVLREHNLTSAKFDFSKLSSREAAPAAGAAAAGASAASASASASADAARANPVAAASADPDLLSFLMSGGAGAGRFMPSGGAHGVLSAVGV